MTSEELLQQQLQQATKRRKPKGVRMDRAAGNAYNVELQRLVREIKRDIDSRILPAIRSVEHQYIADGWPDVIAGIMDVVRGRWESSQFNAIADRIARSFVMAANRTNQARNERDIGINAIVGNQQLQDALDAATYENVQLIKSIPQQYLDRVGSIVNTNMRAGNRPSAIAKLLQDQFGVTERRAKFIARDQTAKINADLNQARQTAAGFEYFEWDDSDDERVRKRHDEIANKVTAYGRGVYRWDNPPLSDSGVPIIPGSDYACRCVAIPRTQAEVDENVRAGRTRRGVLR